MKYQAIKNRWGTVLRILDAGDTCGDRYTIFPPRWARDYCTKDRQWCCLASGETPYHPQGFGQHIECPYSTRLGKRIRWNDLPDQVKKFCAEFFPEFVN